MPKIVSGEDGAFSAALALATAAVVLWQNSRLAVLWDVGYILENASRIAAGDVPYRDFPFPYAPLTFVTQAAIIRIFGHHYWLHIAYAAIAAAVATTLTYAVVRLLGCRPLVAFVLCAPLSFLGIYCIFPHPFYDPDACLAILVALVLFLTAQSTPARFASGFIAVVPLFIKQNIGLAFLGAVVVVLLITRNGAALAGVASGVAAAIAAIASTAGLGNYLHWTMAFAAQRRLPSPAEYFGIWNDDTLWWWLGVAIAGLLVSKKWRIPGLLIATIPWIWSVYDFFTNDDPLAFEETLLRFWPLLLVVVWLRRPAGVPFAAFAATLGAFLSQETWGSTYGIWPLLVILIAFAFDDAIVPAIVISAVMLLHAVPYVANDDRLSYAKVEEGQPERSSIPALRGLTMRGPWIADFEELVAWTDRNIPRGDAILFMPGEDLFYFTSGRRPRVPVLMFDRTINPYSASQIAAFNVRWIIVKRSLQLKGTPMPELPEILRLMKPKLASRLRNYDVYSR